MSDETDFLQSIASNLGLGTENLLSTEETFEVLEAEDDFDRVLSSQIFNICRKGATDELKKLYSRHSTGNKIRSRIWK